MTGESYRLPASMGGHKCEIVRRGPGDCASVEYEIDGTKVFSTVEDSWLTPVKPALPEPRYDAQALIDALVAAKLAGSRGDGVHRYAFRSNEAAAHLAWSVADQFFAPLLTALPDPLAGEPVTLPYERRGTSPYIYVATDGDGTIGLTVGPREEDADGYEITNAEAREFARAVWAAANATERTSRDLG